MKTTNRHPWTRTILFEGVALPGTTGAIDHLGIVPELSEEASIWLWRFTICAGTEQSDTSANVLRFAGEALDVLTRHRQWLLQELPARFEGPFDGQVLDEWADSLRTIIDIARTRHICTWTSPTLE